MQDDATFHLLRSSSDGCSILC